MILSQISSSSSAEATATRRVRWQWRLRCSGLCRAVSCRSAFATVDRVAHALKHVESGDNRNADSQPLKAGDVIERPPAIWGKAVWALSRWGDATGGVTIKNEHERDLLEIVKGAAEFVRARIKS